MDASSASDKWGNLIDRAWDAVLANLSTKELGDTRLVSRAWKSDTGRALHGLHLVDPNTCTLQAAHDHFPGLHNLAVTLTQVQPAQDVSINGLSSLPLLKELSLHGWLGNCVPPGNQDAQHLMSAASALSTHKPPAVPLNLLKWAAGSRRLQVLRITRCALLNPFSIQVFEHLTELHLNNVILPPNQTHWNVVSGPAAPSLLVSVLSCLPKLNLLVIHHQERGGWQSQAPPGVTGISGLPALRRLHLTGGPELLLEAAQQVSGWHQLEELKLSLVHLNHVHLELHDLMAHMQPGAHGVHTLSLSGHSYVSDRHLAELTSLFPSLTHLSLGLGPLIWDAHWNPHASHLTPGGPLGSISRAGILQLIAGRQAAFRALHLPHVPICQDAVQDICRLPGLKELDLSGCRFVDDSLVYSLASAPQLEHLGLSSCPGLTDIGLAQLAVCAPHLTHLDVSGCDKPVTDLGVSRLGSLRQLAHLNLAGCSKVTDAGVAGLLCGYSDSPLTHLNLSNCHLLTDQCLRLLARHAPALTRLVLDNLPSITPHGVHSLSCLTRLTALSVVWCEQAVQEASVQVAYRVLGTRLGPLCSVPPGILQVVHPLSSDNNNNNNHTVQCASAAVVGPAPSGSAGHQMSHTSEAQQAQRCLGSKEMQFSWKRHNAGSDLSDVDEMGGADQAGSAPNSVLEMRFSPSSSCVGFSPLDDPSPVLSSPKWWLA